jgi:hypothetical protein
VPSNQIETRVEGGLISRILVLIGAWVLVVHVVLGCLSRKIPDYFKWVKSGVQDGLDIPEGRDCRRISGLCVGILS